MRLRHDESVSDRRGLFTRGRHDADSRRAASLNLDHLQLVAIHLDKVTVRREPAKSVHDEASCGLVRAIGQRDTGLILEVLDIEQAIDFDRLTDARRLWFVD